MPEFDSIIEAVKDHIARAQELVVLQEEICVRLNGQKGSVDHERLLMQFRTALVFWENKLRELQAQRY